MTKRNVVIIGPARSGSTLLGLALGSHPDALYAGEVAMWEKKWGRFVDNDHAKRACERHFGQHGFSPELINPGLPWRPHPNITPQTPEAEAYLRDVLGSEHGKRIVGKITFDTMPIGHALWPVLLNMELDFVLLNRKNLLRTLVSWRVAFETKLWNVEAGTREDPEATSVHLDPLEVLHYFVSVESNLRYWQTVIQARGEVEVEYEQLTTNWDKALSEVFESLGWTPDRINPSLAKRTRGELSELISNFDELQEFFAKTRWSKYFK